MSVVTEDIEAPDLLEAEHLLDTDEVETEDKSSIFLRKIRRAFSKLLPKGLYARTLLIITTPLILLQSILVLVFMERHHQMVTQRLSGATASEVASLIKIYDNLENKDDFNKTIEIASHHMGLAIQIQKPYPLPKLQRKPFYDILDKVLSKEIAKQVGKPFRISSAFASNTVTILVQLDKAMFRVVTHRSRTYASNSHIFLVWMIGSSIVLLIVAILFLRNQIKPILRLTEAAKCFGTGRPEPADFKPRGATEIRQAAQAFIKMRDRIERHVDQRTTLLAGVSHDLRTVLTRFKLELALAGDGPEIDALKSDVDEMQLMLEDYMAFAKGDNGEEFIKTDVIEILLEVREDAKRIGHDVDIRRLTGVSLEMPLRRHAFKRVIGNLVSNASRFGKVIEITVDRTDRWLRVSVDDDGPGIEKSERNQVFRPFYRIDTSRNQNDGGTGLGLSIARDITRSHGGEITLNDSQLGGLKAVVRLPV